MVMEVLVTKRITIPFVTKHDALLLYRIPLELNVVAIQWHRTYITAFGDINMALSQVEERRIRIYSHFLLFELDLTDKYVEYSSLIHKTFQR